MRTSLLTSPLRRALLAGGALTALVLLAAPSASPAGVPAVLPATASTATSTATSTAAPTLLFADGFENGMAAWTQRRGVFAQYRDAAVGARAAEATSTGGPAYARTELSRSSTDVNYSALVRVSSRGPNNANLMSVRRVDGSPLARLSVNHQSRLTLTVGSGDPVTSTATMSHHWQHLRLQVRVAGPLSETSVWLDGAAVPVLSRSAPLGTSPVAAIDIGDLASGRTFAVRFDTLQVTDIEPTAPTAPVIAAAGDIACSPSGGVTPTTCQQMAVSDLLLGGGFSRVLALGDNQYETGTLTDYRHSYDPSWGRVRDITSPAAGNHEYKTPGAAGYYDYFGAAAGPRGRGYYSFDIGAWHLIALNSNCADLPAGDGCAEGTAQNDWLEADLAAHRNTCTLAFFHHPLLSTGGHGDTAAVQPFWDDLDAAGADVVLSGHSHHYERYVPLAAQQTPDAAGVRQFVVGTGGKSHVGPTGPAPAISAVRDFTSFGVLEMTLHPGGYDWKFVPVAGDSFTDRGSASCH